MNHSSFTSLLSASFAAALFMHPALFGQIDQTKDTAYGQTQTPSSQPGWQSDRSALSSRRTNTSSSNASSSNAASTDGASSGSDSLEAPSPSASTADSVKLASGQDAGRTVRRLTGRKVEASNGTEAGTVKDFLLDPQSGAVRFAAVSTGGFIGIGDKLHLVRFDALQPGPGHAFRLAMTTDELARSRLINEEQFEEDRVAATTGTLVRASKLEGREVTANGSKIGRVRGVVIEPGSRTAMALFAPAKNFIGNGDTFLLPLNQLSIGSSRRALTTNLTRADFQSAAQAGRTASAEAPEHGANVTSTRLSQNTTADASSGTAAPAALGLAGTSGASALGTGSVLAPTGRPGAEQTPEADPKLVAAAHTVRQALDSDPTTAHADVQVLPENGRLELQGNVTSESQKSAIESKARQAANGCPVDSRLKLQ